MFSETGGIPQFQSTGIYWHFNRSEQLYTADLINAAQRTKKGMWTIPRSSHQKGCGWCHPALQISSRTHPVPYPSAVIGKIGRALPAYFLEDADHSLVAYSSLLQAWGAHFLPCRAWRIQRLMQWMASRAQNWFITVAGNDGRRSNEKLALSKRLGSI